MHAIDVYVRVNLEYLQLPFATLHKSSTKTHVGFKAENFFFVK